MMNSKAKIVKVILGPVMFKTRFLNFIETNDKVLDNFVFVVDNYELYEPYKDIVEIVDIEKCRETHSWSKKHEWICTEKDPKKFIKNYMQNHNRFEKKSVTIDLLRFGFLDQLKKGYNKIVYQGANYAVTNNEKQLNDFLDNHSLGNFNTPLFNPNWRDEFEDHCITTIKPQLQELYPNIKFPDTRLYFDGHVFTCSFRSVEDGMLFYEIWDNVLRLIYENTTPENNLQLLQTSVANYTWYEKPIGYVMKIFEENFGYSVGVNKEWEGYPHVWCWLPFQHDAFYMQDKGDGSGDYYVRFGDQVGFKATKDMESVEDFIKVNKTQLADLLDRWRFCMNYEIKDDRILFTK